MQKLDGVIGSDDRGYMTTPGIDVSTKCINIKYIPSTEGNILVSGHCKGADGNSRWTSVEIPTILPC
jgi:hypothetical protein